MKVLAIALRSLGVLAGAFVLLFSVGFFETGSPGFGVFSVLLGGSLAAFSILFRSSLTAHGRERTAERTRRKEEQRAAQAAAAEEKRRRQQEIRQTEQAAWHAHVEQQKAEEARRAQDTRQQQAPPYETADWRAAQAAAYASRQQQDRGLRDRRRAQARQDGVASCPRCGSTSLSINKQGYGAGKAILFGPLAGTIGMNKLRITCLNCGYKFKPGKGRQ